MKKLTTIVDISQPADLRTGLHPILRRVTIAPDLKRTQVLTLDEVSRLVLKVQQDLHDVTEVVQQMPEGGARTYFKDVAFVSGIAKTLNHLLGVATPQRGQFTQSSHVVATDPGQIRFQVCNQRGAFGGCYRSAVDARTITLVPSATFTADVILSVV